MKIYRNTLIEYFRKNANSFLQLHEKGHVSVDIRLPDFIELEVEDEKCTCNACHRGMKTGHTFIQKFLKEKPVEEEKPRQWRENRKFVGNKLGELMNALKEIYSTEITVTAPFVGEFPKVDINKPLPEQIEEIKELRYENFTGQSMDLTFKINELVRVLNTLTKVSK